MAMDQETQRSQLKKLIIQGKEQGFLTYREINDHLPEDVHDTDQIEAVVNMINDMGIAVYDEAPDPEDWLALDEDERQSMGQQARSTMVPLTWESHLAGWERLFQAGRVSRAG